MGHRSLVGDGALNVIDADVIAKDRPRIGIRLRDGRPSKTNERSIRQRIAHVARQTVNEIVLAMRLVCNHDDVAP